MKSKTWLIEMKKIIKLFDPVTESVGKNIVTIPIHPNLKKSEIQKIIDIINKSL
jgi:dTDP-4-amino-4,6-dideoxygalactose transaminase